MAQPYTRVTLIGPHRHVDLLLPSQAAVGTLMPQILDLLGDRPGERVATKILLTASGEPIPSQETLAGAGVLDGERLTLFNNEDAPPPAVVYDIADTVVEQSERVRGPWTRAHLVAGSGVFAAAGFLLALELLLGRYLPGQRWWISLAVGGAALALGAATARAARPVASTLLGTGWAAALLGLAHWDAGVPLRLLLAAAATAVLTAGLAAVAPDPRPRLTAAAIMASLTGAWALALPLAAWAASADGIGQAAGVGGIAAVASLLVLGLLPGIALSASGLARLDDRRAQGDAILRRDAVGAIQAAHAGLALSTVAVAASIAAGLWLVATAAERPVWTFPLLAVLVLATLLRARSFPLALERYALYAAAGFGAAAGAWTLAGLYPDTAWLVGLGVLVAALLTGLGLVVVLPEHTQARLRQLAERVETLAVLASVPLVVGYFGVFAKMLETF
ncbi:type VII secretion integral membrane protein EccD [Zafaria sp. J156]|uniref:type VII secretion integral membrane protein EccD n=1 Tax=Zafaria sp. J156 TaxID=3116490 RepID=UPI002E76CC67|nr:type VII secretion integral membrane protein EccD [Zafaria sp. J156]MEE1621237.1 type VII secretion integral membrane protein EccD [Zafaria sp. J156]